MVFIHTLRMIADLSVYFFIAELFVISSGAQSQLVFMVLLGLCYGLLAFSQSRNFRKIYMLLPIAVLFLPGSHKLALLPAVVYILFLIYKEEPLLSWDRQSDLFSLTAKLFPLVGVAICFSGNVANFIQYSLPMAFISLASSIFLMRMLRQPAEVYLNPNYLRKNCFVFISVLCMGWLFSRDFMFALMQSALSFVYMKGIYPVLNGFIYLFMGVLRILMYIFSWFKLGEVKFEENHLEGGEMGFTFKEGAVVAEHAATTETVFAVVVSGVLMACAFFFFRWLALNKGEESFISQSFDIVRGKESVKVKKERPTTTVLQVRKQYRIFLKLYKENGGRLETAFTSEDVLNRSASILPDVSTDILEEMRQIYLKARYAGTATKTDLKRMKHINKELAASTAKKY
ncbi:MAG: hypothetical protein IKU54_04210 [Oscillospiraceae bacterium]|nr:hypothetical protein [Oscillospiraceae bacterium]